MTGSAGRASDLDALLRRVARQDVDAFARFHDDTRSRVYGLVTRVLRDPGYSEETTQDVYLQVWRNAGGYDPAAGSALAWLLTLAHRRAVDRVRAEQAAAQRDSRYGAATANPPVDVWPMPRSFARSDGGLPSVSDRSRTRNVSASNWLTTAA
jgi:RNA polymerase sigma-70 factor (ECF subfamily)